MQPGILTVVCALLVAPGCGTDVRSGDRKLLDARAADLAWVDGALDAPESDAPVDVAPAADAPLSQEGPRLDQGLQSCATHCDCPQGWFCYQQTGCVQDPQVPVFCCAKPDCPPGNWCVDPAGAKSVCPEDPGHVCTDACDCGPAHCCIVVPGLGGKRCVKHTDDPWTPGGTTIGGAACAVSPDLPEDELDATYCASDPSCHAAKAAWASTDMAGAFRAFSRDQQRNVEHCGGNRCFGTACNCDPGQSCVDTVTGSAQPGSTCLLLSGGSCISNALAEALFDFKPGDLLPCCASGCTPGQPCDAGWLRSGNRYAYQRLRATCGPAPATGCACGDGICCAEELGGCMEDCIADLCGDGVCQDSLGETVLDCPQDCGDSCGDGWCSLLEDATTCAADCAGRCQDAAWYSQVQRICGDGTCHGGDTCSQVEPETCLSCPQDCGPCQWRLARSEPDPFALTNDLWDVWAISPGDVYAVGTHGTILHYDGQAWQPMVSGVAVPLYGVWGSSPSDVFAVGFNGALVHYDGQTWQPMVSGATTSLWSVWGTSPTNVFTVGGFTTTTIVHYDGQSWSPMSSSAIGTFYAVWGSSPTDLIAVGYGGIISRYDGQSWSPVASTTSEDLLGLGGASSTDIFAVGTAGTILRFDGQTWTPMTAGAQVWLYGVWGSSKSDLFAVGSNGTIAHDDGSGFKDQPSGVTQALLDVWGRSPTDIFAFGLSGTMVHYDGTVWSKAPSMTTKDLRGAWGSATSDLFVVGDSGTVLHHDGATWSSTTTGDTGVLLDVWGLSGTEVFAVGLGGVIHRYDGQAWAPMPSGTTESLEGIWGSSGSDMFAVGWGGTILRYDGQAWAPVSSGTTRHLLDVWGTSPTNVFAVGWEGTILRYDGSAWHAGGADLREHGSVQCRTLTGIRAALDGTLVIVGEHGGVLLTAATP